MYIASTDETWGHNVRIAFSKVSRFDTESEEDPGKISILKCTDKRIITESLTGTYLLTSNVCTVLGTAPKPQILYQFIW